MKISDFARSYIECLAWTGHAWESEESEPIRLDDVTVVDAESLPPDILKEILSDCEGFCELAGDLIEGQEEQAGHDFCLTRNGHGAGFWDGAWAEDGDELTRISKSFGSQNLEAYPDPDNEDEWVLYLSS